MTLRLTSKVRKYVEICFARFLLILSQNAMAEPKLLDDFKNKPEDRWEFIADTVMGGISSGQLFFSIDDNANFARMVGKVSTENNGGVFLFF